MRTQSEDTNPEIERVQIELLRKAGMVRRLQLGLELSGEPLVGELDSKVKGQGRWPGILKTR